jgi:hypothetical protein
MTAILLIVMALLLIAALERTNRRQAPHAPGLYGAVDHDDHDWARIKLDLLALDDEAGPLARKSLAINRSGQMNTPVLRHATQPAMQRWNTHTRNGPRAA